MTRNDLWKNALHPSRRLTTRRPRHRRRASVTALDALHRTVADEGAEQCADGLPQSPLRSTPQCFAGIDVADSSARCDNSKSMTARGAMAQPAMPPPSPDSQQCFFLSFSIGKASSSASPARRSRLNLKRIYQVVRDIYAHRRQADADRVHRPPGAFDVVLPVIREKARDLAQFRAGSAWRIVPNLSSIRLEAGSRTQPGVRRSRCRYLIGRRLEGAPLLAVSCGYIILPG